MSYSGDAAEQVVRMSLQGAEVAAKITGEGAKHIAVLIYAILKEQNKTKGQVRLTNMLKSGKELKVFAVKDEDLKRFCTEAKKYGVLYCVLKDKNATDGITDIMVRAEDASKINRIFERFQLATVDIGSIQKEIQQEQAKDKIVLEEEKSPFQAKTEKSRPSEPISTIKKQADKGISTEKRPSVRDELRKIQEKRKSATKQEIPKPSKVKER
ncbi:MAG TPA: PcfB family protein [Candidatus Butyricicoccus avistercoris]|uniref:PcfB family protein n=1 Tax=Candidatus Butyricicoccus avistercoris TaxID=2838518 RepID=A0A9D1THH5_9FIRM|nr:PcfB family protein [Candidatus Butyricicoccus avistercoris]